MDVMKNKLKLEYIQMEKIIVLMIIFMIFAAVYAHGFTPYWKAQEKGEFAFPVLFYLIVFVVIMVIGLFFYKKNANEKE